MSNNAEKETPEEMAKKVQEAYDKSVKLQQIVDENRELQAHIHNQKLKLQKKVAS